MNNWKTKKLCEICDITRGGSPRPIQNYIIGNDEDGYPWLRIGDVPVGDRYIFKTSAKIKPEGLKKTTLVKKGDFILSNSMSFGRPYIMMIDACIHDGWLALRNIKPDLMDKHYLYYLLTSDYMQNEFLNYSAGSGVQNLKKETVKEIKYSAPDVTEQQRIVSVLETWDGYLELLDKKIALKEQLKKGLMQQLLTGKKRLPGFSDEWKSYKLSEIASLNKGVGLSKDSLFANGSKCILYGEIYTKYDYYIDEITSRTIASSGTKSVLGDIIIPASTTTSNLDVATATVVNESGVLLGGDINIIRPKARIDSPFLSFMLNTVKKHDLAKLAQGVTIIHLYGKDILKTKVEIPSYEEQADIAEVLLKLRKEVKLLNDKRLLLEQQKKYLLKNLITGAIRTPESLKIKEAYNA